MKNKKYNIIAMYLFIIVAVCAFVAGRCTSGSKFVTDTIIEKKSDTTYIEKYNTLPIAKAEKIIKYVTIPSTKPDLGLDDSTKNDTAIVLPVVQKTYTDDSTYTAYVSGLKHEEYPKLDSIITRQRTITNTITQSIRIKEKRSRWSIGIQGGYGLTPKGFQPYIGAGIEYSIIPP
jgi:opacity protein-like surface antigen